MASTVEEKQRDMLVERLEHGQLDKETGDTLPSVSYDKIETRKILRKVDKRLLPVLTLLYLLSFLDRGNSSYFHKTRYLSYSTDTKIVGNARTLGMQRDLQLSNTQWNMCLTIFFFPYAAFEVPSNIVLKLLRPNIWLTILILSWGTTMTLMSLVEDYEGLLVARFFLGMTEVCTDRRC
jgi:hypothetical protein